MDFTLVELDADDEAFLADARAFLAEHVTDEVRRRDRETGDNFDEGVHLAIGAAGYLEKEWTPGAQGGFSRVRRRIWELEKRRVHTPWVTWGTTAMVARAVAAFGKPELVEEVMPKVFSGEVRMCLGYTEPEGGSDIATCKTRAVREADGSSWIINGSKMFTTGAHNCQYVFLITNTDPQRSETQEPDHVSGTHSTCRASRSKASARSTATGPTSSTTAMSGSRTSTCSVRSTAVGPCCAGHWMPNTAPSPRRRTGCRTSRSWRIRPGSCPLRWTRWRPGSDNRARTGSGRSMTASVAYRLGRSAARLEAALSTASIFGRVAQAQTMRDIGPELMDLAGPASVLPIETDGAADDGASEYLYRFAPLAGIYGGTLEVFRNMIAQHVLGLGKPNYSPPKA